MKEESRREFLKKSGKVIITGAGWSAVSVLGAGATGCTALGDSDYWCDYCKSCTYYRTDYETDIIRATVRIILNGWGYSRNNTYNIDIASSQEENSLSTNEFGRWTGNQFSGDLTVEFEKDEIVSVDISSVIFTDPAYTEGERKTFQSKSSSKVIELGFNNFPVGAYFSVKNPQSNTTIGTVNVVIKDPGGNVVTSEITDPSGFIKLPVSNPQYPDPLAKIQTNTFYNATFSRSNFVETTQEFIVQLDSAGIASGSAYVVYMESA